MSSPKLKIAIVGLGYIGLPTAAVLASVGHEVVGTEVKSISSSPTSTAWCMQRSTPAGCAPC